MGKNSPNEIKAETDFVKHMCKLPLEVDLVYEIVKSLEGVSIDNQNNQSRNFGISYVVKFLEKYCRSKDDYEFMLATYGFLEGFTYIDYKFYGNRVIAYWQYACGYKTHEFIKTTWGIQSVPVLLRKEHRRIIIYLDEISQKVKAGNDSKLGLIEEVPKKLVFPKPRIIKEISVEHSYGADASTPSATVGDISANEEMAPDANEESDKLDSVSGEESNHTENQDVTEPENQMDIFGSESDSVSDDDAYKLEDMFSENNPPEIKPLPIKPPKKLLNAVIQIVKNMLNNNKILRGIIILLIMMVLVLLALLINAKDKGNPQEIIDSPNIDDSLNSPDGDVMSDYSSDQLHPSELTIQRRYDDGHLIEETISIKFSD